MKKLSAKKMEEHRRNIPSLGEEETKRFLSSLHYADIDKEQKDEITSLCEQNLISNDQTRAYVVSAEFEDLEGYSG